MFLTKTHFLPRTLSTGGRHLPSTNRLGLLKPLSSNSTPTDHSVTTATSLAGWLHIQWPTTTLVVTLQCLTGAWDRCSSSNLGTSGSSGGREREATCQPCVPGVLFWCRYHLTHRAFLPLDAWESARMPSCGVLLKVPSRGTLFLRGSRFRAAPRLRLSSFTGA